MGGYVAEEMMFGDITTGPSSDLQVATNLARAMVTRWGMSTTIGPIALSESDGGKVRCLAEEVDRDHSEYSERVSAMIDEEVSKIMNNAFDVARKVLTDKREVLDAIAKKLIEVETLEQEEYNHLIKSFGIEPKVSPVI
jgi:cell division protease FtsH